MNNADTHDNRIEEQLLKLTIEVTDHIIDYHCDDEFDREKTIKCEEYINWMLQTKSYRNFNLPLIELLAASIDLILYPKDDK